MKTNEMASNSMEEAFRLEANSAQNALQAEDRESAWTRLFTILTRLAASPRSVDGESLFVTTTLDLSHLSFVMGRGFGDLVVFLQHALTAANRLGNRRSRALVKLHLGRLYYFGERRHEALALFAEGKEEIEQLGDEDILIQAAEFLGLHYFIQGLFREATVHLERAVENFETRDSCHPVNPSAPMWLGYCAVYMGDFHRAIGILDYYRRVTMGQGDRSLASTFRAVLGLVLLIAEKHQEASTELSGALKDAISTHNALALYFSKGGLAMHHCLEGRLAQARDMFQKAVSEAAAAGLVRQYASPMILEMLFEFHRSGLPPVSGMGFHREVARALAEPNIHLRGVALRLNAMDRANQGEQLDQSMRDLEMSEQYLIRAGTPVQLAKTRIEMARLKLKQKDTEGAHQFAQSAWKSLCGYGGRFYPDDLRHLLEVRDDRSLGIELVEEFPGRLIEMFERLVPSADLDRLLTSVVAATNRFFGAERGAIFWFSRRTRDHNPVVRGARNLTVSDVTSREFQASLALVRKAYRENVPQVVLPDRPGAWPLREKALICLPFEVEGQTRGVLYHDNSYLSGCFDFLNEDQLVQMARYLSTYVGRIHECSIQLEKQAFEALVNCDQPSEREIVACSPVMKGILAQMDFIAASEGTVLILGESGVGKELIARRIHLTSQRSDKPLVIVDPTAIPENLVESELFGHEKGAFTGADRQRRGRIELAHGGTLFIDEVGEMPKSLQVKLLRVLQERTFVRIGGTRTIHSDFRLITATNRDLAKEVAAGRFREDLYYRLNVLPINLPPLRDRIEDVPVLAHHFLNRFAVKYNRVGLALTPEDVTGLQAYGWPGNVRELANIMERAVLLSNEGKLIIDLNSQQSSSNHVFFSDLPTLEEMQRRYIRFVLEKTRGKIAGPEGAAHVLGMKRSSLYTRMERLGIR